MMREDELKERLKSIAKKEAALSGSQIETLVHLCMAVL